MSIPLREILATYDMASVYAVHDLWNDSKILNKIEDTDDLILRVNPSGVAMVKLIPQDMSLGAIK